MSADSVRRSVTTPAGAPAESGTPQEHRATRRRRIARLSWIAGAVVVVLATPAAAFGIAHGLSPDHGTTPVNTPQSPVKFQAGRHSSVGRTSSGNTPSDYEAYVALAGGSSVAEVSVATDTIVADSISADTAEGVAVTPDGSQLFVAQTGQYSVVAVDLATGAKTNIEVGAYPQDVAVSPDGTTVYATLTGGDTGPGGSSQVAVISTASDKVTGDITVGAGPHQVAFSPDGRRAYVTTEQGITVIDTATQSVVARIAITSGAQGLAVNQDGSAVYVTSPATGKLTVVSSASDHIVAQAAAGAEPYSVAITPDGKTVYVADTNSDSVEAISASSLKSVATIGVGGLPGVVAVVPDGSQVWVGNIYTGNISVINLASNTLAGTISGGTGTATLNAAPLGIAFVAAPSTPSASASP